MARDGRYGAGLIMVIDARFTTPSHDRQDCRRDMLAIAGAVHSGYDDGRGVVRFNAAIQQMEGFDDHSAREYIVNGNAVLVVGFWVIGRVF